MRGVLAGLLALVGLVLVPLADAGAWTRRELLPREQFVDLATKVLEKDEVRVALAQRIADEVDQRANLSSRGRSIVEPAIENGLTTAPFRAVYQRAVADMHDQIVRGDK